MKRYILLATSLVLSFLLAACGPNEDKNSSHMMDPSDPSDPSDKNSGASMMMGHHNHDMPLDSSTGENELVIPPLLKSDKVEGNDVYYTLEAQQGKTEFFEGIETDTLGYNGSFLGPVVQLKKGQTAHVKLKNSLDEETTFHWHGLIIGGEADGGPHDVIAPGDENNISFEVKQDPATLWFHPHPEGKTSKQVFDGLAGLLYIEDDRTNTFEYGENDFPLIIQDRTFTDKKQLDYEAVMDPDGTMGETLMINGTVNPRLTVPKEKVRLRLLNGSNMRNYTFELSNGEAFQQIASDGGLLNEPVELTELQLTPSERAEIVIDFSQMNENEALELVMDDGTVLLPFQINEEDKEGMSEVEGRKNPIQISEEEMNMPVSKEVVLSGMGEDVLLNGKKFDMNRIDFTQKRGETEVWEIYNKPDMMGGMIHPFHIHGTQFKIISINGEDPPENLQGYKDTVSLDPDDKVKIAVSFEEEGVYMFHCHILEHEDNGMMGQIEVD